MAELGQCLSAPVAAFLRVFEEGEGKGAFPLQRLVGRVLLGIARNFVVGHPQIVVTTPVNVVAQQGVIDDVHRLVATVFSLKLTDTDDLPQHGFAGLLLIGFVALPVGATLELGSSQLDVFVDDLAKPLLLNG